MGTRDGCRSGCCSVTATWCLTPPAGIRIPARAPTCASLGPPVSTTRGARISPSLVVTPGHLAIAAGEQAAEGHPLGDRDAAPQQGHGVGGHVARRAEVPVVGAERAAQRLPWGQRRVDRVHLVRVQPYRADPELRLHGQPLPGCLDLGRGEARQQVALADEARVGAELRALPEVEPAGPDAQAHRLRGAALQPDHARGAAARALAEHALLDQHDTLQARRAQEVGAPRADRPAANHDRVRGTRKPR